MKKLNSKISLLIVIFLFMIGCSESPKSEDNSSYVSEKLIQITQKQFDSDNMKIGKVSLQQFEEVVKCNGYITAPANAIAQISTPISGKVESINCYLGDYVHKGQVVFMLSSTDLLEIQQDFVINFSKMEKVEADYKRAKALYDENIGTEKEFIAAASEYKTVVASHQSLKLRLELLKLNVPKIEEGELYSVYPLTAPISGFITSQHVQLNQFIEQKYPLAEVIDTKQLNLQLSIFENDISMLEEGQAVQFYLMSEPDIVHLATITSIGKTISNETKTIQCLATITDEAKANWINQSYVEAKVIVAQTEKLALPSEALTKMNKDYYAFVVDKIEDQEYSLRPVKVTIGMVSNGFTEIKGGIENMEVIINGVYNLPMD